MNKVNKVSKELKEAGYLIAGDQVTNLRGDVVGQMDPYGTFLSKDDVLLAIIEEGPVKPLPVAPKAKPEAKAVESKSITGLSAKKYIGNK
jgi:hypothetical protein